MLEFLLRISDKDKFLFTKPPLDQYSQFKRNETGEEIKPLNEHENSVVVLDVFLG